MDIFIKILFLVNLYTLCVAGNEWTSTSFPFETADDEISSLSPEDSLATEFTTPATASSWDEDSYQEYFHRHYNQTFIDASGVNLPKPSTISESTLRGFSRLGFLDGILFPKSFKNMVEPLKTFLNLLLRLPIIIAGLIVGENAELLGLQAMQVGNAFLLMGAQGFGEISCFFSFLFETCEGRRVISFLFHPHDPLEQSLRVFFKEDE